MLILQHLTYFHPNKDLLFENLDLTIRGRNKMALVGKNGIGKSTLLKIMAGELQPSSGTVTSSSLPYYIPQLFGQFDQYSIGSALRVDGKLRALREITEGHVTNENLANLDEDWTIEERCREALAYWDLDGLDLGSPIGKLSGGQKTKVFLAGIAIHQPEIALLDEPSNHLDLSARRLLYDFFKTSKCTMLVVSHDRKLLDLPDTVVELDKNGLTTYGGNYSFYRAQKQMEKNAFDHELRAKEKELRKAKETARETAEKQQRHNARGKKKQEKAGMPTILINSMRNSAENSTARLKGIHAEKVGAVSDALNELRKELPDLDKMKFGFDNSTLHKGKILVSAKGVNFGYGTRLLWDNPIDFQVLSGERIALKGNNGSGKTTLIRMITGDIEPVSGSIQRAIDKTVYIDQDYSIVDNNITVFEQVGRFNHSRLQEHELKSRLNRFLFTKEDWDKAGVSLSGGEKMRLTLCCLTISEHAPDIIILDEPTNNLDIQNMEILTAAINEYMGTLIVVSHDEHFLESVRTVRSIDLNSMGSC
ncbi:ribosomal protection-like ABC-F family protein [Flavihumibacter solisilvae]|uniref:ABC transporter ATP-binding protein n=1 Tax=Flavihumibacter solisilvae TaxID=1349421 RepID=A0A0C1IZU7_9BACT|nr:ABC-F family ATP-binding cassette domain-containing protein [Flavihumibacter solisilvae]KIC96014.1 ABC transporter ATP-binding protein [Flavihumibacter solisilvae]